MGTRSGTAVVALAAACLWAGEGRASHLALGAGGAKGGGPITTVSGSGAAPGSWLADLEAEYVRFDPYSERELLRFAAADRDVHSVDSIETYTAGLAAGVTPDLSLHVSLPYVIRRDIAASEPPDEVSHHGDSEGLGDASVHAHYSLVRFVEGDVQLSLTAGLKVPTGETREKDAHGQRFEAEFQPGSGSWDPYVGLSASAGPHALTVHGNVAYTLVTEGTQDTDLGDRLTCNAAAVYHLVRPLPADLMLEVNGVWQAQKTVEGSRDPDSGGHLILLSPGLRLLLGQRWSAYASWGLPVVQNLRGDQGEATFRVVVGASASF